jgi:hypothetical protein
MYKEKATKGRHSLSLSRRRFVQGLAAGGAIAALDWGAGPLLGETKHHTPGMLTGDHFDLTLDYSCTFAQTKDDSTSTWKPVEAALGRPGQLQPGEVYKFALPRKDMKIVKDGGRKRGTSEAARGRVIFPRRH